MNLAVEAKGRRINQSTNQPTNQPKNQSTTQYCYSDAYPNAMKLNDIDMRHWLITTTIKPLKCHSYFVSMCAYSSHHLCLTKKDDDIIQESTAASFDISVENNRANKFELRECGTDLFAYTLWHLHFYKGFHRHGGRGFRVQCHLWRMDFEAGGESRHS